jgi:hypothetical protein
MEATLSTGGERVAIRSAVPWVSNRIREGADGCLAFAPASAPTVRMSVDPERAPFDTRGWVRLTRDAWCREGHVVVENVATSGFDMHLRWEDQVPEVVFRWCPPHTTRAAGLLLRQRARLLVRAVLLQYPVLWVASTRGRAPMHAPALSMGAHGPALLAGPGGVGKTTLVEEEIGAGGVATGDNLSVGDGRTVWGVVEPMRTRRGTGRPALHGRREARLDRRVATLEPRLLAVLQRGTRRRVEACHPETAARALVASTYAAGELRRYWPLHAVLALGTGLGPPHPPVSQVAAAFAARLRCLTVELPSAPEAPLADIVHEEGAAAWT